MTGMRRRLATANRASPRHTVAKQLASGDGTRFAAPALNSADSRRRRYTLNQRAVIIRSLTTVVLATSYRRSENEAGCTTSLAQVSSQGRASSDQGNVVQYA